MTNLYELFDMISHVVVIHLHLMCTEVNFIAYFEHGLTHGVVVLAHLNTGGFKCLKKNLHIY